MAIKRVFGDDAYRLAISSPKSMTGHLTCAAGGAEPAGRASARCATASSPPTINLENPDPKLDLDYVPERGARDATVRAAMVNAFAFGGTNALRSCVRRARASGHERGAR